MGKIITKRVDIFKEHTMTKIHKKNYNKEQHSVE